MINSVQFMNAANRIEHFTIMRIREEQNLNVNSVKNMHFVRIELEHSLSIRVHESDIRSFAAWRERKKEKAWCEMLVYKD